MAPVQSLVWDMHITVRAACERLAALLEDAEAIKWVMGHEVAAHPCMLSKAAKTSGDWAGPSGALR